MAVFFCIYGIFVKRGERPGIKQKVQIGFVFFGEAVVKIGGKVGGYVNFFQICFGCKGGKLLQFGRECFFKRKRSKTATVGIGLPFKGTANTEKPMCVWLPLLWQSLGRKAIKKSPFLWAMFLAEKLENTAKCEHRI